MVQKPSGNPFPTAASQAALDKTSAGTPSATGSINDGPASADGVAPNAASGAGSDAAPTKAPMVGAAAAFGSQVHDSRANKAPPAPGVDPAYDAHASGGASSGTQQGLGDDAGRFVELARDSVSKNPLASVAVAVAVGLLLAKL